MAEMMSTHPQKILVKFQADGIRIKDEPHIIICASVFYFRLPREEWTDRLIKVKAAGYNCIETYVPWNYHEAEEGIWDFTDEKDVSAFLEAAAAIDLWVIVRPGPYICSEWDMGSLPAYLLSKENLVLREFNMEYLRYVKRWYDRILPIVADYQLGRLGTVIAVQLENELDFYNCREYDPYIAALRAYAVDAGIEVPVFVCAGQCDIRRAGGLVEGVLPTINLYPEIKEREVERRIHHYIELLREHDHPLCITETGSRHFILRRELVSGAKLIAPYNQVGGMNFGFTTAVNNWGHPLNYLPHDYDLGGMISPRGEVREEYKEALLFTGLIHSLKERLALSWPEREEELQVLAGCRLSTSIFHKLSLHGGGKLIGFANIDDDPGEVQFILHNKSRPAYTSFIVRPAHCPMLPFDLPLEAFGIDRPGSLLYSTAELGSIRTGEDASQVMLYTDTACEIAFDFPAAVRIEAHDMSYLVEKGETVFISRMDCTGTAVVEFEDGSQLHLKIQSREAAVKELSVLSFTEDLPKESSTRQLEQLQTLVYHKWSIPEMGKELGAGEISTGDNCKAMEKMHFYRGYGWYEGTVAGAASAAVLGYIIEKGMDIIHLYRDGKYLRSLIGDGTHQFVPEEGKSGFEELRLGVRCEIWGHSNFSDSRLPAMDIRSGKGIRGLAAVYRIEDISEDWYYSKDERPKCSCSPLSATDVYQPRIRFGSFNNPEQPQCGVYRKKIWTEQENDTLILILSGLHSYAQLYVDGAPVKTLQPYDYSVSIDLIRSRQEYELAIYLDQKTIQESEGIKLTLYEGRRAKNIVCCGAAESQIASYIEERGRTGIDEGRRVQLKGEGLLPGTMTLYSTSFSINTPLSRSLSFRASGRDAKLLLMLNGRMIGRLWLPCTQVRPLLRGGDDAQLYLPRSFFEKENRLDILIEAMLGKPEVTQVYFNEVYDNPNYDNRLKG